MGAGIQTKIFEDGDALARAVARDLSTLAAAAASAPFTIALSGGSTPKRLYELLAAPPCRERVPWTKVELFFGDERSVPPEHPDSNYGMAKRALLDHVPVTAHRMRAEHGDAEGYARLLGERIARRRNGVPVLDVVLLGMGEDGHTASLFPGTAALGERARWVVMNDVPQLHTRRMTLTYPVLNAAERVWVLSAGAGKRTMVAECLAAAARGDDPPPRPIVGIRPTDGELIWFLDKAAAGPTA
ncbi:MAG: 6-phosphogluconolactonase [Deltaproteobacteria bacterium]|nr:6-phosphogluconolactonase [Deltaproteobacteria bacterium]